jgi:hypothetical protein
MDESERRRLAAEYEAKILSQPREPSAADRYGRVVLVRMLVAGFIALIAYVLPRLIELIR